MNTTALQESPITLDRRLVLGETDYQVTAFPTDDNRIDLCIVSSDGDGHVVSEISGGLSPADLVGLTDVLTSTLAGLIAMTRPSSAAGTPTRAPGGRRPTTSGWPSVTGPAPARATWWPSSAAATAASAPGWNTWVSSSPAHRGARPPRRLISRRPDGRSAGAGSGRRPPSG